MAELSAPEKELRGVSLRIGIILIVNMLLLLSLLGIPGELELAITGGAVAPTDTEYALLQTLYGVLYMLSFMAPVLLYRVITPLKLREPMRLAPRGSIDTVLAVTAGIGIVFSVSSLGAFITSFVDFSGLYAESPDTPVALCMDFAVVCIVPAVCEEFLFRGCVLSNLLPFGKTNAVIASALMFALMHGNIKQFLYAFCAGIVLGMIYTESGSIVPGMLMHFCNNFFDLCESKLYSMYGARGEAVYLIMELCIMAAALASAALLIYRRHGNAVQESRALPTRTVVLPATAKSFRLFLSPTVLISMGISAFEAISTVFAAFLM
ncbi:MAG: CPBP family intramembrane metalloprotease [Clostridia bacterium]|nr:CPBP family intramembrane metalloprotease [Clostridia bacterium]